MKETDREKNWEQSPQASLIQFVSSQTKYGKKE
jgi:hypothetical protein